MKKFLFIVTLCLSICFMPSAVNAQNVKNGKVLKLGKSKKEKASRTQNAGPSWSTDPSTEEPPYISSGLNFKDYVYGNKKEVQNLFWRAFNAQDYEKAKKAIVAGAIPAEVDGHDGLNFNKVMYKLIKDKNYDFLDFIYEKAPYAFRFSEAIHCACSYSDVEMVEYLVSKGASLVLIGQKLEYLPDKLRGGYFANTKDFWNNDATYSCSPYEAAFYFNNQPIVQHLSEKYHLDISEANWAKLVARFLDKENKNKDWAKERLPRYLELIDSHPEFVNAQYETLSYKSNDEWFVGRYPLFTLVCEEGDKAIIEKMLDLNVKVSVQPHAARYSSFIHYPLLACLRRPDMLDIIKRMLNMGVSQYMTINGSNCLLFDSKYGCRQEYIDWFILESGLYK